MWQNIFGNAVKFTAQNGSIGGYLNKTETGVCVRIKDNGIGMDPDTLQRIYEKFYQGDRSHSGTGNGLGMALAKRIVDLHGGEILIKSEEGKESEFTVILPTKYKSSEKAGSHKDDLTPTDFSVGVILLITFQI